MCGFWGRLNALSVFARRATDGLTRTVLLELQKVSRYFAEKRAPSVGSSLLVGRRTPCCHSTYCSMSQPVQFIAIHGGTRAGTTQSG